MTLTATEPLACAQELIDESPTAQQLEFFETEVRPLLAEHCYECHSARAKKLQADLRVDSRKRLLAGGESGPAIVPGEVEASSLIEAVRYESYEMPPKGKLPDEDIQTLERWVRMGAPWPAEKEIADEEPSAIFDLERRKAEHWAWQPIRSPIAPKVHDKSWPLQELDHFILNRLEQAGWNPSEDADRGSLLRRVYFDLTGLPPTPGQIEEFLHDERLDAFERLVDQVLESPHFGERWGRHWLDLVRYAESRGHEYDNDTPNAFQFRDYIIRALNADVPYDQLVREHIAGDLFKEPRLNPERGFNESILGTGFWYLGEWAHAPVDIRKDEADRFDNMIDVMSKTFLGVTVSCARCHDHKFDAISTADYYSISGFLQSSDYRQVRFESLEHNRQMAKQIAELDRTYRERVIHFLDDVDPLGNSAGLSADELLNSPWDGVLVDYAEIKPEEFMQDGFAFGDRPRVAGEPFIAESEGRPEVHFSPRSAAVSDPAWNDLKSIHEGFIQNKSMLHKLPRSGRTLRTPTFELKQAIVHCRVRGRGHVVACVDSHRMVAGPLHTNTVRKLNTESPWTKFNLERYVGHRLHLEFTPALGASLEVSLVLQGASPDTLQAVEKREKISQRDIERRSQELKRYFAEHEQAEQNFSKLTLAWSQRREELQRQIQRTSRLAMAMLDGTGEDDHVLIRGNSSNPGKVAPRRFLTAIAGDQAMPIKIGSGRLELAEQINDANNPLTSRVAVNRIWHYLMGRGIVATTDDFGFLGQRPTHPELLDHLATRFVQDGKSIKRLIRYVMLSRTYQMGSHPDAKAILTDRGNQLWHHRPPKRLEGEVIRDALLAISGQLDKKMLGPPVPIHLTKFMEGRGRPAKSGPLDGENRRSIYISVRRNFLSPFMSAFDTPAPFSTMGRRNVSNVPAQALSLMNDPLVSQLATKWGERALEEIPDYEASSTPRSRINWMYLSAFGRDPTKHEQLAASNFLSTQSIERGVSLLDRDLWSDFAHALINTKEFIFLR